MNLNLSDAEQRVVSAVRGQWSTLTDEAKAEIANLARRELGFISARPWTYTLCAAGAGALIVELFRLAIGHP
jgi:hypothetical protein